MAIGVVVAIVVVMEARVLLVVGDDRSVTNPQPQPFEQLLSPQPFLPQLPLPHPHSPVLPHLSRWKMIMIDSSDGRSRSDRMLQAVVMAKVRVLVVVILVVIIVMVLS